MDRACDLLEVRLVCVLVRLLRLRLQQALDEARYFVEAYEREGGIVRTGGR
jgi:hypothetical protein